MDAPAVGVLVGVFDLFHVGHLDAVRKAATLCDRLVVAVASDDLAARVGHRRPFVPETEREQIVSALVPVAAVSLATDADLDRLVAGTGAGVLFVAAEDAETSGTLVSAETVAGVPVVVLPAEKTTAATAVRSALAGRSDRSSVA